MREAGSDSSSGATGCRKEIGHNLNVSKDFWKTEKLNWNTKTAGVVTWWGGGEPLFQV